MAKLSRKGFKVLNGKPGKVLLSQAEFVRASYAFTGAPVGKSLHDQKLYLKNAGIIKTSDIGMATEIQGKVVQLHEGSAEEIRTELASPVFMHDKIRTGTGSKARFTLDDGSALTMAEDSIIRITKNIYDPDKDYRQILIKVSLGAVRFVVAKVTAKGSLFQVVTPTVTAGVRGTEFIVTVAPDGATRIIGIDGSIVTEPIFNEKPAGKKRILGKNQTQAISKTGKAGEIIKAPEAMIKNAVKRTTLDERFLLDRSVTKVRAIEAAKNKLMRGRHGKDEDNGKDRDERSGHSGKGSKHDEVETEAARAAEDAAKEAEDAAEEAAKEAEDAAEQAAKDAEDAAEEAAKDAEDTAKDAAKEAEDARGASRQRRRRRR